MAATAPTDNPSPLLNQIVKIALDRDEALISFTEGVPNTNNTIPYSDSFESYTNGFSLVGTNGWCAEDSQMAVVMTNSYTNGYTGSFPILGPHQQVLQVSGAVTNRFSPSADGNVWVDFVMQGRFWTDPLMLAPSNATLALCITTNGHLAVWNCTNPPAVGNGWTELQDTSIASNQFTRVTIEADYDRDANGQFHFRFFVTGIASVNPQTWYTAADTNQNYLGELVAQGDFALDDLVVTVPTLTISNITHNADGSATLHCAGMPALPPLASWPRPTSPHPARGGRSRPACPARMVRGNLRTQTLPLFRCSFTASACREAARRSRP